MDENSGKGAQETCGQGAADGRCDRF